MAQCLRYLYVEVLAELKATSTDLAGQSTKREPPTEWDLLVYAKVMSTGMGMVYSAPAAPIKVAFIVGAELMVCWPDW